MLVHDTIIARASPPGRSGRALIRLSGPAARGAGAGLTGDGAMDVGARAARLVLPAGTLPVLVTVFCSPRSYTGQDSVEIQVPGNPFLVERVMTALLAHPGVRLAQPGEFTARAYLAGKLTLEQAEGIGAAIAAQNSEQLESARSLANGITGARYRRWADELTTLAALVEAGIDFTDQDDVVAIAPARLAARLGALTGEIRAHLGAARGGEAARALVRVALVGRPNAGKSTLFNALLGRARAIASPIRGTTRDVLEEELDLSADAPGAGPVLLQDLAGLDGALAGRLDRAGQDAAIRAANEADVWLWCDPSGGFESEGLPPLDVPRPHRLIRVRTFADLPGGAGDSAVAVCALDGWNLGPLRRAIADAATGGRAASLADLLPRHRRALGAALTHLGAARAAAERCVGSGRYDEPEVIADALRAGLDALGELVGGISPDDVLGRVFATFCVGK